MISLSVYKVKEGFIKAAFPIIFILSVLTGNSLSAEYTSEKKLIFRDYLGYSIIGCAVSIPPAAYIGRTYYNEEASRERGQEYVPFKTGSRLLAVAFTLGSSTAAALHSQHKWQVFALALTANSIPIVLMYKNFSYLLGFYSLSIPVISAIIGFKFDEYRKYDTREAKHNPILLPNFFIHEDKVYSGISLYF